MEYVTTLPNILRQYNPSLYGFSTGTTPRLDFINLANTRLNVALSGAKTTNLLQQAQDLVRKIRGLKLDFDRVWKLITVLIGYNDLCESCMDFFFGTINTAPDTWSFNVMTALDYLRDNLPRTLINLVQLTNFGVLRRQAPQANSPLAPICRFYAESICPCLSHQLLSSSTTFDDLVQRYRQSLESLVESGRYNQSSDFTVVLQPFQRTIELGGSDPLSFLAPDCSHFSATGNRLLAISLWNNMFESVGSKSTTLSLSTAGAIHCPTNEHPYIATSSG